MKFTEYINYLLDIGLAIKRYKNTRLVQYKSLRDPVGNLLEEIDVVLNTPSHKLKPSDWFDIGYTLAQYFGKEAVKMVYGVSLEELMKGKSPKGRNR